MRLTTKVITFSVGMLTVLALSITITSTYITYRAQKKELKDLEVVLRRSFDDLVKHEVETVISLLNGVYHRVEMGAMTNLEAQDYAAHLVRELRYASDGYFWVDTREGINVVYLGDKSVEGQSRWDIQDTNGKYLIREIIKSATDGDGFTEYWFPKKGGDVAFPKRSYSSYFKPFDWVVGTGNYIDDINTRVETASNEMIDNLADGIIKSALVALVILVLFGFLSVLFGRRITRSVVDLSKHTELIASGDLAIDIKKTENDEIGLLQASLKETLVKLKNVMEDVIQGSVNVFAASAQMAQSAEYISEGANTQAASTEEISTSIEQMVANIQSNTENAKHTESTASRASQGIEHLQETVKDNLNSMESISSKVGVIKEIAMQTNLLALNASVEASRAGDSGKGFAVVASEVRKLSEFTQKAADEINELAVISLEVAQKSWNEMEAILPDIRAILNAIKEIFVSSQEQEVGASQINKAIQSLVSITSQNSASAEEMSSSSEELSRQAEILKETISYFKIR